MRQRVFLAPAMPRNQVAVLVGEDVIAYGLADDPKNMEAVRVTDGADVYFSADVYEGSSNSRPPRCRGRGGCIE